MTAVANIVTAVFTAVAAIAGIGAVIVAMRARGTAASANITAKDANAIARGAKDVATRSNEIAIEANRISKEAVHDARDARLEVIWHNMLKAVNRFLNFNPSREDLSPALNELRVSAMLLGDELELDGLDKWLAQEQVLLATIGRDCDLQYGRNPPRSAEEEVEIYAQMSKWATVYLTNLRYLRKLLPSEGRKRVSQLAEIAAGHQPGVFIAGR